MFKMKLLAVLFIQFVFTILENVQVVESHALRVRIKRESSPNKLEFVDNLLQQLVEKIQNKKHEIEDPNLWPADFANSYVQQEHKMTFDYIIVGAGTAGSVVASRLSENPLVKVLVLEAGDNPPIQSEIHLLHLMLLNTPYSWNAYAEPSPSSCQAMKKERCYWTRGRMIGGSSGINGNVFLPGYPEDYDAWQQQGNQGWSWRDMYPFYVKATTAAGSKSQPVGSITLNSYERLENYQVLKDIMINSTNEVEKFSEIKSPGFNENITVTVDRGIRMSPGKTYLGRVNSKRPNLYVIKNSEVTEILFEKNQAVGVKFLLRGNKSLEAKANREVIISAGTFNTPKLLMLSGVGPLEHLKTVNISLVKDLPVGQNLQERGMLPLVLKFTRNIPYESDTITTDILYEYLLFQKGPLASGPTLVGFFKTLENASSSIPDVMMVSHISKPSKEVNVYGFLQFKDDIVQNFLRQVENGTTLEIIGAIIKPKSYGFVELKSNYPLQEPVIHTKLGSAEKDKQKLLGFIRLVQKLQKTAAFKYYGLELVTVPLKECDRFLYDSDNYWLCYIRYFHVSAWHATGTSRMGPVTNPTSVVDERLRVHGIKGLRVIDASIMPNITSVNTYGSTVLIAEKGAQLIRDDWP